MPDLDQGGETVAEGEEGPNMPSQPGELGQEGVARNSEALPAAGEQADAAVADGDEHLTGKVADREAADGEAEPSATMSEHGDEPGHEADAEQAEILGQEDEEAARKSIIAARNEEPAGDEPDLSTMDAPELRQLVLQMRADHNQQLQAEERARAEVEDMCLRIEKHFKAEKVRELYFSAVH